MAEASPLMLWIWRNRPSIEERRQLYRVDVQDRQERVHLVLGIVLRALELRGQGHARGHVGDRHQHVRDGAFASHAVEVELEVAGFAAAFLALLALDHQLHFVERVDRADQVFLRALAPQHLDELGGDLERLGRHEVTQQFFEGEAGNRFALEQLRRRVRVNRADLEVAVEQEETFAHGREDVFRLLLGSRGRRRALAARQ
jgi:hypothetical protein